MKCEGYRVLVSGYIDGELSDREMRTLKMHLDTCTECLHYLQHQEKMQLMFKRYSFVQEVPKVPDHFASSVTERIHETLHHDREPSFIYAWTRKYQRFALRVAEILIQSLKVRPLAWTASMSSALLLLVGFVSFQLYQYSLQLSTPHFSVQTEYEEDSPLLMASITEDDTSLLGDMEQESLILFEDSESPVEEIPAVDPAQGGARFSTNNHEHVVRIASQNPDSVEEYVYSHVMEVYQERLVEDVVLVRYVQ